MAGRESMGWGTVRRAALAAVAAVGLIAGTPGVASAVDDTYNGANLWLRYDRVSSAEALARYRSAISSIVVQNASQTKVHRQTANLQMETGASEKLVDTTLEAARDELSRGLSGLLGRPVPVVEEPGPGSIIVGTAASSPAIAAAGLSPSG